MQLFKSFIYLVLIISLTQCAPEEPVIETTEPKQLESLPFNEIDLKSLAAFEKSGSNWQIAGGVYADYADERSFEVSEGTGILVNKMSADGSNADIETSWSHGDLDLELEFLLPKNSNSGIYLQNRYELQISDSYLKDDLSISSLGAIYERWDESKKGNEGYEGVPPSVNASKAPGLWQKLTINFIAPKFDSTGIKIMNARLDKVLINDVLIHENVELTGPTRGGLQDEVPFAPLRIQGDHGNIAFKNIKYKSYTQDSLSLKDITYEYFDYPHDDIFPNFDTITSSKSGEASYINVNVANENREHYGLIFKGTLDVPVSGDYLFHTSIDDGGDLIIDDQLVVHNDGESDLDEGYGLINLSEGQHQFQHTFYNNTWRALLKIWYEGPGISKKSLGNDPSAKSTQGSSPQEKKLITKLTKPEMVRSFVEYKGKKKTHTISVGSPEAIHYSYDLSNGSLLRAWRGEFADVSEMWIGRGEPQLLKPLNAAITIEEYNPLSSNLQSQIKYLGYSINEDEEPIFSYEMEGVNWTDHLKPAENQRMLQRTLRFEGDLSDQEIVITKAKEIVLQPNGLYNIDGQYYIMAENAELKKGQLKLKLSEDGSANYYIFW